MFKTILVATDGSDNAKRAVSLASQLAEKFEAKLIALHVMGNDPLPDDDREMASVEYADELEKFPSAVAPDSAQTAGGFIGMSAFVRQHREKDDAVRMIIGKHLLQRAENEAQKNGANDIKTVLKNGDAASRILKVANENNADLIVVGSRGLGTFGDMLLGSVSNKVSHRSDHNVMIVK